MELTFWDLGGKSDIRKIWKQYLYKAHFVIFVIDASDTKRLEEAKEALCISSLQLAYVLDHEYSYNKPTLVVLNKIV